MIVMKRSTSYCSEPTSRPSERYLSSTAGALLAKELKATSRCLMEQYSKPAQPAWCTPDRLHHPSTPASWRSLPQTMCIVFTPPPPLPTACMTPAPLLGEDVCLRLYVLSFPPLLHPTDRLYDPSTPVR